MTAGGARLPLGLVFARADAVLGDCDHVPREAALVEGICAAIPVLRVARTITFDRPVMDVRIAAPVPPAVESQELSRLAVAGISPI